jgi:hypothetical protein
MTEPTTMAKPTHVQTRIGALVASNPERAHLMLVALFKRHITRRAVAEAEDVPDRTVDRWIKKLAAAGYADPRTTEPAKSSGVRQPTPRTDLVAEAARRPAVVRERLRTALRPRHGESASQARQRVADGLGLSEITVRRVAARVGLS